MFILYILQASFFVACLTLDQRRIDANRNACVLCYVHKADYKPNIYYRFSIQNFFFKRIWGPLLTKLPIKVGTFPYNTILAFVYVYLFLRAALIACILKTATSSFISYLFYSYLTKYSVYLVKTIMDHIIKEIPRFE